MQSLESTKKLGVVEYVIPELDRWGQENSWDSRASLASLSIPSHLETLFPKNNNNKKRLMFGT